jgi:hypothetical protein
LIEPVETTARIHGHRAPLVEPVETTARFHPYRAAAGRAFEQRVCAVWSLPSEVTKRTATTNQAGTREAPTVGR